MKSPTIISRCAALMFPLLTALFHGQSEASVVIILEERDGNVIATTSGSYLVPSTPSWGETTYSGFATGGTGFYLVNNFEGWSLEWQAESMHWGGATSASGDTFGFNYGYLYLPVGIELGSLYTPQTTWIWESTTLEEIGLNWLTTTPYELSRLDGETISIALAPIPEPSSVILIGLAGLSALLLRHCSRVTAD